MNRAARAQFDAMKQLHTPRAEFVAMLESRIVAAPATAETPEHFPAQMKAVFNRAIEALVPPQFAVAAHRLSTVLLVFGVAVGGWIATVSASYNSVPGDALYNVKLATEKVQLVAVEATGDKTKEAKLHTEFAERRANEVKKVIETNKEPEQARTAIALLTKSVNDASEAVKEVQANPATSEAAIASTEALLEDTERIAASLREVLHTLPPNVAVLIDEIVVVQGELTEQRLSTLQDIVHRQLDGDTGLTIEETRAIVVKALKEISDSTDETATLAKQVEETKRLLEVDAAITTSSDAMVPTVVVSSTSSQTAETSTIRTNTSTTPDAITVPSRPTAKEIKDLTLENDAVERLVESGDLIQALEKAKEINTKQVEIEKTVKKEAVETGVSLSETGNQEDVPADVESTPNTTDVEVTSSLPTE